MNQVVPPVIDVVTKGGPDWPAIIAAIVTGIAAVLGIAATAWQAQRARQTASDDLNASLSASNERALMTDRRGVYAKFMAAFHKTMSADVVLVSEWDEADEEAKRLALRAAHTATLSELFSAQAEVNLVAPIPIARSAGDLSDLLVDNFNELCNGDGANGQGRRDDASRRVRQLNLAMRADLDVQEAEVTSMALIEKPRQAARVINLHRGAHQPGR